MITTDICNLMPTMSLIHNLLVGNKAMTINGQLRENKNIESHLIKKQNLVTDI